MIAYNQVIAQQVAAAGGTLVDIYSATNSLHAHPPVILGYPTNTGFLGGLFLWMALRLPIPDTPSPRTRLSRR